MNISEFKQMQFPSTYEAVVIPPDAKYYNAGQREKIVNDLLTALGFDFDPPQENYDGFNINVAGRQYKINLWSTNYFLCLLHGRSGKTISKFVMRDVLLITKRVAKRIFNQIWNSIKLDIDAENHKRLQEDAYDAQLKVHRKRVENFMPTWSKMVVKMSKRKDLKTCTPYKEQNDTNGFRALLEVDGELNTYRFNWMQQEWELLSNTFLSKSGSVFASSTLIDIFGKLNLQMNIIEMLQHTFEDLR